MQPIVVPLDASARPIRDSAPYDAVDAYGPAPRPDH
jgi:hypothetical protein